MYFYHTKDNSTHAMYSHSCIIQWQGQLVQAHCPGPPTPQVPAPWYPAPACSVPGSHARGQATHPRPWQQRQTRWRRGARPLAGGRGGSRASWGGGARRHSGRVQRGAAWRAGGGSASSRERMMSRAMLSSPGELKH